MKILNKTLAVLLSLITILTTCSAAFPVFAENSLVSDESVMDEFYLPEESDAEAEIVSEITENREEKAKHFLMSDGSFMVAQYDDPVHELDNSGNWVDIDNTITKADATTEQTELFGTDAIYSTSNTTDNVVFAEKSNSNTLVSYEAKDYPISLNYRSAKKSDIKIVEDEIELSGDDAFLTLPNVTQEVIYEDVFTDVDLQYIVSSTGLKENIILKSESAQNSFTVNYNIGELTAEVVDSNTINLMAGDEVVYTISAPYMTDANGEKSVAVTLLVDKNKNGKLRVNLTADSTWLQAENRAYPVVVDPSIVEKEDNELIATYVSSADATTNYGDVGSDLHISKDDNTYGTSYALLKLDNMENNVYADHVVSAKLNLPLKSALLSNLNVYLYEVTSDWDETTVTWNSKPEISSTVTDYCNLTTSSTNITFDITKLYYLWGEESANSVAIKLNDAGIVSFRSKDSETPVLLLNYISTVGIDEDYSYSEFDMGSAGHVYINNLSGNLVLTRDEINSTGENYPYDLTRTYNSLGNISGSDPVWMNSYDSTIYMGLIYVDSDGSATTLTLKESEGDSCDEFEENEFGWEKISVLDYYTITIPRPSILGGDIVMNFPNTLDTWRNGATERYRFNMRGLVEQSIFENEEEQIVFSRESIYNEDGTENNNLFYIVDGDGEKLEISDTANSYIVKQINAENNSIGDTIAYIKDTNGNVTQITLNGNVQALFTYDEFNRMTSVTNDVGYKLTFDYQSDSKKIASISESKSGTAGQQISFTRTYNSSKVQSAGADGIYGNNDDVITTYKFNKKAQLVQVHNSTVSGEDLGAAAYTYDESNDLSGLDGLSTVSAVGKNVINLLQNHNLESTDNWVLTRVADSASDYTVSSSTEKFFAGTSSLKIQVEDFAKNGLATAAQTFTPDGNSLEVGKTYTASAYVNTEGLTRDADAQPLTRSHGAYVVVRIITDEGTSYVYSDGITQTTQDINDGWERTFATFTVPENYSRIDVMLSSRNAIGTIYFDCVQLETGDIPNQYNILENNGFDYEESNGYATNWSRYHLTSSDIVRDGQMQIVGDPDVKKGVYQDIQLSNATQNDTYTYSAWAKADAVPFVTGKYFIIYPYVYYKDAEGTVSYEHKTFYHFNYYDSSEQYTTGSFNLKHPTDDSLVPFKIRLFLCYYKQCNTVSFDNVALYPSGTVYDFTESETDETDVPIFTYDTAGNILTCTYNDGTIYEYTYHALEEDCYVIATEKITEVVTDDDGTETTETTIYTYNTSEQLVSLSEPDGTVYYYTYNENGDLVSRLNSDRIGDRYTYNSDGYITGEIYEDGSTHTYTYYNVGELATETIVEDGKSTVYTYAENGNLISKDETDSDGTITEYDYVYSDDTFNNLLSVSKNNTVVESYVYTSFDVNNDGVNDKTAIVSEMFEDGSQNNYEYYSYDKIKKQTVTKNGTTLTYHYDNERKLTRVDHNGFSYVYEYDNFGNRTNVKVGNQSLISYNYQADKSKLSSIVYGNGSQVNYSYDAYGNIVSHESSLGKVQLKYDALGNLVYEVDNPGSIKTYYKYDESGRLYGEEVATTTVGNSGYNFLYSSYNVFDDDGNVIENRMKSNTRSVTTGYSYTESGLPLQTVLASTRKVNFAYDEAETLTSRTLTTNTPVVENLAYSEDGYISTHTIIHGEDSNVYSYTYDDNGNIIEIKRNDVTQQSYVYDANSQLIRENNIDTNKTTVYTYDGYGNILTKTEYAFTLGELGTVTDTVNYAYDNTWKDKLTNYDGQNITYDSIGNPINYMGADMTWFGRQMMSYTTDDLDISFKYDSEGLRTQKVVNGVKHEYYYVDGKLRYERNGDSYEMYYGYDADGRPSIAVKRDLVASKNYYYYLITNTRGDIIETRDGNGNINSRFVYDSWGKLVSVTDGNGNELSTDSFAYQISLKYRGYVYDYETGLYYLQSRYYDPETGRFLNADSVDYIGYSDSVISYNVFAYCENNAVNSEDYTGCISYSVVKTNNITDILNLAANIYINSGLFYYKVSRQRFLINSRYVYSYIPNYNWTHYLYDLPNIKIYMTNRIISTNREVGVFGLRTVEGWNSYIANKHKSYLLSFKSSLIKKIATRNGKFDQNKYNKYLMYWDDFISALGEQTAISYLSMGANIYSMLEALLTAMENKLDNEDKYIKSIIKNYNKKTNVLILLRSESHKYYTKYYQRGIYWVADTRWYKEKTKYPY